MNKSTSARLPEFTFEQINMLKRFYEIDDPLYGKFSTSRIIIICVNYFWKHVFESHDELDFIRDQVMQEFNK